MKFVKKINLPSIVLLLAVFFSFPFYSYGSPRFIPENFSELAKSAEEAVVNIRTVKTAKAGRNMFPQGNDLFDEFFRRFYEGMPQNEYQQRSLGSGFIIDEDGYIVTNNHVVENADTISVKLKNGEEYEAKKIGADKNTDLALIKITVPHKLHYLDFGDSEKLNVGEWVVAIGSPFGLEQTVTAGIVSAKGRVIQSGPYDDFIQTDASINPGNSGGPLLNLNGKVVGINTAILANAQGIGFAIPSNMASSIIDQLKDNGEVVRGWLGVEIQELSQELAEYHGLKNAEGVFIARVFKGDPAESAGIMSGDIVVSIDNQKIKTPRDLTKTVAGLKVGSKVKIEVIRNGKKKVFDVAIAKRGESVASEQGSSSQEITFGVSVADIDRETAKKLGVEYGRGVVVVSVDPQGKAYKAGLKKYDVILQINHKPVDSVSEYTKIVDNVKKGQEISIFLKQYGKGFGVIKFEK